MYLYFSVEEIMEELKEIARTPAIPETLMIHKDIRKCNSRNICCLEFFNLSDQSLPILQQVYRKDNYLDTCDHMDVDVDNNTCAYYFKPYGKFDTQEWLECPGCCKSFHENCFHV